MIVRVEHLGQILTASLAFFHSTFPTDLLLFREKLDRDQFPSAIMQVDGHAAARQQHDAQKGYGKDSFHGYKGTE